MAFQWTNLCGERLQVEARLAERRGRVGEAGLGARESERVGRRGGAGAASVRGGRRTARLLSDRREGGHEAARVARHVAHVAVVEHEDEQHAHNARASIQHQLREAHARRREAQRARVQPGARVQRREAEPERWRLLLEKWGERLQQVHRQLREEVDEDRHVTLKEQAVCLLIAHLERRQSNLKLCHLNLCK